MNINNKIKAITLALTLALGASYYLPSIAMADTPEEQKLRREIGHAEYYLKEFEKEVELQHGGVKSIWRSKKDALDRVQKLKTEFPNDPQVDALFQRAKIALMKSKGDYKEVHEDWIKYKTDASNLIKIISKQGLDEWNNKIASIKPNLLEKEFPTPDTKNVLADEIIGKYVILNDVLYPTNQFYGSTGEYAWHGKPSTGLYFLSLDGREWLSTYEAIKRYRRTVDSSISDNTKYTVLGKITDITAEIPDASAEKKGKFTQGWVVEPIAINISGHVTAFFDANSEQQAYYSGEDQVPSIKDSWYSVKSIPNDVTPERLAEIFMTAIKEKNFDLYVKCINPERNKSPTASELLRYHWDLHQERFANEYVHATFEAEKIQVIKGFDENNDQENFFLDDDQKDVLRKTQGELVEKVIVNSRAYDENGKQVGSPHPHELIRVGGGRWYIEDYAARF